MERKQSAASTKRQYKTAVRKRHDWLPFGLIGLGTLVLAAVFVLAFNQAGAQTVVPPRIGSPLSNFSLTDIAKWAESAAK